MTSDNVTVGRFGEEPDPAASLSCPSMGEAGGPHFFVALDPEQQGRVCIDCQAKESDVQLALAYSPANRLDVRYDVTAMRRFQGDPRLAHARSADQKFVLVEQLASSPHWEDRVFAEALRRDLDRQITMPDQFPCIYEPASSPRNADFLHPRNEPWVVSADAAMLEALLPLYQELWAAYESQWPHSTSRVFVLGHLDGVSPTGVYRPGTTPEQVIGATMITHSDMYRTAPEHLRRMHPQYEQWNKNRTGSTV